MFLEPGDGRFHDGAEGRLGVDFVVAEAGKRDQFLRLAGLGIEMLGFFRWDQPVVIGGDEQDRSRSDLVDDPFGMELQGLVDVFEWQRVDGVWVGFARGGGEIGGLAVRQQDVVAVAGLRGTIEDHLLAFGFRGCEQIVPFIGAADAAHPTGAVANADAADDALNARIDCCRPDHGGAAIAGAVDAEAILIDAILQAEEGHRGLDVGDAAVGREATAGAFAVTPALVVESQDGIAGVVEHAGVVRQVEILDARIAVAQDDAGARLPGIMIVGQEQIAIEFVTFAEEVYGLTHNGSP